MKAKIVGFSIWLTVSAALAAGADPQLLSMVMPDAQAMAGVNVEQARTSPFGQWVLGQMQGAEGQIQSMTALTGFDPRRDVRELLVATAGGDAQSGLLLARGTFDVARIAAAAKMAGAPVEIYRGATLVSEPKKQAAFAFVDGTTVVAGTPAMVRAALDRRGRTNAAISPALATKVNQLSTTLDAWAITMAPPSTLMGAKRLAAAPPQAQQLAQADVFQKIQQASGGVKFGVNVSITGEALAATAQDAQSMSQVVQFLANMAATQTQGDPTAASLVKSLQVTSQGQTVKLALSMPQAQIEQMMQPRQRTGRQRPVR